MITSDGAIDPKGILEEITHLAGTELDWQGPLSADMRLVEDLRLDSIRLLTLAMAVEDRFRICLDEEDEANVVTVGDLVSLIERKLSHSVTTSTGGE